MLDKQIKLTTNDADQWMAWRGWPSSQQGNEEDDDALIIIDMLGVCFSNN